VLQAEIASGKTNAWPKHSRQNIVRRALDVFGHSNSAPMAEILAHLLLL